MTSPAVGIYWSDPKFLGASGDLAGAHQGYPFASDAAAYVPPSHQQKEQHSERTTTTTFQHQSAPLHPPTDHHYNNLSNQQQPDHQQLTDPVSVVAVDQRQLEHLKSTVEALVFRNGRIEETVSKLSYNERLVRQQVVDHLIPQTLVAMEPTDLERMLGHSKGGLANITTSKDGSGGGGGVDPLVAASVEPYDKLTSVRDLHESVDPLLAALKDYDTRAASGSSTWATANHSANAVMAVTEPSRLPL